MTIAPTSGSNGERTRRAIFEAAVAVLTKHGSATTLRDVAEAAGISKSGLLHHFPSKEALIKSVATDFLDRFRIAVLSNVQWSENRPGKLLRAYVRTLCAQDPAELNDYHVFGTICETLSEVPEVAELIIQNNERWRHDLLADGMNPALMMIVQHAAEGLATASSYDAYVRSTGMSLALPELLQLTERD